MTPPASPCVPDCGTAMHHLITPTARIFTALIILMTGGGIAAVFWKMPTNRETHDLYRAEIVDKTLAATPLPSESVALFPPGEVSLPTLDIAPALDSGREKYTQVYPAPVSLAAHNAEREEAVLPIVETEEEVPAGESAPPQKFSPMRHIVEKKPISADAVDRDFQPKPTSVGTLEKSDEMLSLVHFAGNSRADADRSAEPAIPVDPFPVAAVSTPSLQPLKPLPQESLSPLFPVKGTELQPLSVLSAQ